MAKSSSNEERRLIVLGAPSLSCWMGTERGLSCLPRLYCLPKEAIFAVSKQNQLLIPLYAHVSSVVSVPALEIIFRRIHPRDLAQAMHQADNRAPNVQKQVLQTRLGGFHPLLFGLAAAARACLRVNACVYMRIHSTRNASMSGIHESAASRPFFTCFHFFSSPQISLWCSLAISLFLLAIF